MATVLTFRRDPVERFEGAVATALTWEAVRRMRKTGGLSPRY